MFPHTPDSFYCVVGIELLLPNGGVIKEIAETM